MSDTCHTAADRARSSIKDARATLAVQGPVTVPADGAPAGAVGRPA